VSSLSKKIIDQIRKAGLPSSGKHPYQPRLTMNKDGEQIIEKKAVTKGPKQGKKGYVDVQGRIWIKRKVFGLLANGSTRCWDVAVEATLEGDEWCLEIDGPQTYLLFQLEELKVIEKALRYLEIGPRSN
jgi:predicted metallo-beta-lactamase superfamily hydrolase